MMVETYLRRGQRSLQRMALDPRLRGTGMVLAYGGSGFLLSAASLGNAPQPLAAGMICAATGWRALVMSLGAMAGYPAFWGSGGLLGIVWSAASGLLALLVGKRQEAKNQPLMIPAIAAFLTVLAELIFFGMELVPLSPVGLSLRMLMVFFAGVLFLQVRQCRDPITDWLVLGIGVLALAPLTPAPWLSLGCVAAGVLSVYSPFPAAALGGLALDLGKLSPVPMTGVMCLCYFLRMIPFGRRWQHYAIPGGAFLAVMGACGVWDPLPLPGLALGGALAAVLPPRPQPYRRRGNTGAAQVRLELGAGVLQELRRLLAREEPPPIDAEALLDKARTRACGSCSARKNCEARLTVHHLDNPLDADCRKQGRLLPELRRAQEQLKGMKADRQRQREYRQALGQQYHFLSTYLQELSDRLPHREEPVRLAFRIQASARSRGREQVSGDRCLAFPGSGCRYYVLLCDGMGTGPGAARESSRTARLLRQMLAAGFPASHALETVNSLLALGGRAGAATVDLAEVRLDTGHVQLYKWGAAPSWLLTRGKAQKIGTASPPPGLSLEPGKKLVEKLSLRRGEVLILLSDGAEAGEDLSALSPDLPPGELAAKILEGARSAGEDDATAAVIRLTPLGGNP